MKSYTTLINRVKKWALKTDSTTEADLAEYLNDGHRNVCSMKDWDWLFERYTIATVANQQAYKYPAYCEKPRSVVVTVSSITHTPIEITSRSDWDFINQTTQTSDTPQFWYAYNGEINLYPRPASNGNSIIIDSKVKIKDLSIADYTTGSISELANGGTAVTGSGTSWTASMAGRWIRITESDTANKGDGQWYKIASVASTTSLTLLRAYGGTTITAGSANYTIGQMPLLPEFSHLLPAYWAASEYWLHNDATRGEKYLNKYKELLGELVTAESSKTSSPVLFKNRPTRLNPNLFINVT